VSRLAAPKASFELLLDGAPKPPVLPLAAPKASFELLLDGAPKPPVLPLAAPKAPFELLLDGAPKPPKRPGLALLVEDSLFVEGLENSDFGAPGLESRRGVLPNWGVEVGFSDSGAELVKAPTENADSIIRYLPDIM
jgi:hypothetical protein